MSGKYALIIGNTEYVDPGLAQLSAPGKEAEDFARVLKDRNLCAFDEVMVLSNEPSSAVLEKIDEFFDQKKPDDMLILYFSGHGVKDESGSLYLAFKNTIRSRLRSTAVKSDYIKEAMDQSRSKRQVLILDCCNSGAFAQGTKAEIGGVMGLTQAFQGYGRFVLTASDATQFAWEGDKVIGSTNNSLFTHFLLKGLEGEADSDGDGRITIDELYDYAYEQVSKVTPKQTPTKSAAKVEGEFVLRQNMRIEDIKPVVLPDDLLSEIEDLRPLVREGAVQRLRKILSGRNIGLRRSALDALEKIVTDENTTRRVGQLATEALEAYQQIEQKAEAERKSKEEAERLALLNAQEARLARENAEAEKLAHAKVASEAAEREALRLKTEREAAEIAARQVAEKATQEKAEQDTMELAARKKAEREAIELVARKNAELEAKENVALVQESKPNKAFLTLGITGVACIALSLIGYMGWKYFPSTTPVTESSTQPSATQPQSQSNYPSGTLKIVSSLPMTGSSLTQTATIVNAMQLRLQQAGGEACDGKYTVTYEAWDDASAALGQWDPAVETENANKAAADKAIVAYLGTFNSGAAKLSIPILNGAGPLVMISPANTNPGLTKADKDLPGVTDSYYPTGVRSYARVVAADDIQGKVAANFVKSLGAVSVYILDDQQLYGKGVADVFEATAGEIGLTVVGHEGIDPKAADYKALMTKISTSNAGGPPDAIYVGMVVDSNASQLLKDKVAIMGDNETVKFVGPDGVQTQAFIDGAGADVAEGAYASVAGVPFAELPASGQKFVTDYKAKFGKLTEPYSVYGYETMSVALKAIEDVCTAGDDPTNREAVRAAVFAIKNFEGALGTWSFDANGDTTLTEMTMYVVRNGSYQAIGTYR